MTAALNSAQREVIERRQFQQLPEPERQWVKDLQDLLKPPIPLPNPSTRRKTLEWKQDENQRRGQLHVWKDHVKFTIDDFGPLFEKWEDSEDEDRDPEDLQSLSDFILTTYFDCIIRYKNQHYHDSVIAEWEARRPPKSNKKGKRPVRNKGGSSKRRRSASPEAESERPVRNRGGSSKRRRSPSPEDESDDSEPPEGPHRKVAYISDTTFSRAFNSGNGKGGESKKNITRKIRQILEDMDLTIEQARELDYLFLPHFLGAHHVLMGIAPKQGFAFVVDSCEWVRAKEDFPVRHLLALALHICPADKEWPIYGKWSKVGEHDSLPCAKQGDMYNCGVFTSTNMMCLALGYRLMCYRNRDMNRWKRHRMAAELAADGFGAAPFDYEILDVPTTVAAYRTGYRYIPPQAAGGAGPAPAAPTPSEAGGAEEAEEEEDDHDEEDEDGYDEDEDEMEWSEGDSSGEYDPNAGALKVERRYPSTRLRFRYLPKEDTPTIEAPKATDVLWPAQFDSEFFSKAGFVYKTPTHVADEHLLSRESIIRTCKTFGIQHYKFWSREPITMFRRWFQNEVAGGISSQVPGGLKPMGFNEGLIQKAKDCRKQWRAELISKRLKRRNKRNKATIKTNLEKRRSFGERGLSAKLKKKCAMKGCSLEFEHKGHHLVL